MGPEKVGMKTGSFFHLFDWNRKSRKKLFANGAVSADGTKQGRKSDDNLQPRLRLIDDDDDNDEIGGVSSVKGSSDYSCASSFTDEEGNGIRAPGVVARLMGLDSLPTSGVSEPHSTPLFDSRSLRNNHYQKRSPELHIVERLNNVASTGECYARKPMESRFQKMPSSPIERFQTEVLPPRSAKALSITHYKLMSPIKNPMFISGKNAAHIMEAAAKILEPGLRANAKRRVPPIGSSSLPLKVQDSKESMAASQRTSMLPESSRMPVESNTVNYLRGQPLNKRWNGSEDNTCVRASPDWEETSSVGVKSKGKSISLAIQAKVNVQRREGLSTSSRSALVQRKQDEFKLNQPFKSQPKTQKIKLQKKASTPAPGVLKQNNQKQNYLTSKHKSISKPSVYNQQGRKVLSGDASSGRNRTLNKLEGNTKVRYGKEDLQAADLEKEGSSLRTKNVPRKKRLIDGDFHSEKGGFTDNILVGRHEKRVQRSVVIDKHPKWGEDNKRNGTDVVSFTFTSPMIKPMPGSQSSTHIMETRDLRSDFCVDTHGESHSSDAKNNKLSSLGLNMIGGDALSILLEQKLRELTSGFESSYSNLVKVGNTSASASHLRYSSSAFETTVAAPAEYEKETTPEPYKTSLCSVSDSLLSSINGQVVNLSHKLQGAEGVMECSSSSDTRKEPDHRQPSPLSILEASFSNESCNSSESCDSTNGSKICFSVQAHSSSSLNCEKEKLSGAAEMDLSDSASSSFIETVNVEHVTGSGTAGHTEVCKREVEYVREILRSAELNIEDLASGHASQTLDPLLFDLLENKKDRSRSEDVDKDCKLRKVLFDCVTESLESKCSRYFRAGYRTWAKGTAAVGRTEELADETCKEILGWRSMGFWMVDELVDRDMSTHLGRWVDFETEAFEMVGVEIEKRVLSCLMDEVVADFFGLGVVQTSGIPTQMAHAELMGVV